MEVVCASESIRYTLFLLHAEDLIKSFRGKRCACWIFEMEERSKVAHNPIFPPVSMWQTFLKPPPSPSPITIENNFNSAATL